MASSSRFARRDAATRMPSGVMTMLPRESDLVLSSVRMSRMGFDWFGQLLIEPGLRPRLLALGFGEGDDVDVAVSQHGHLPVISGDDAGMDGADPDALAVEAGGGRERL